MGWIRRLLGRDRAPRLEAADREPPPVLLDVTNGPVESGHRIPPPPLPRIPLAPARVAAAGARRDVVRSPTMRWVPSGQSVNVGRHTVPDGMIYVGSAAAGMRGHPSDSSPPCLVNPDLKVAVAAPPTPPALDYWPSYAAMTPQARATYLDWLVAGRRDPAMPVGYAFVYFYGLERRLLLDRPQLDERAVLVAEVERLRGVYGIVSGSFEGYASTLLREVYGRR